jgi:hypothetical protein
MKINEIADVVQHPAMKRNSEYDTLLGSDEPDVDAIIAFIMDDNNPQERRIVMLRRLDQLLGDEQDSYDASDLEDFMHDQGDWKDNLRTKLANVEKTDYGWKQSGLSDEEIELQIAKDLKLPPYHLSPVEEETFSSDSDIPTGEYEICDKCFGDGCPECEEGLVDVTGEFKLPNFDDLI